MTRQPTYMIISRIAVYNDEYYFDMTGCEDIANPQGVFTDRAEAEAEAQRMGRQWLRTTSVQEMCLPSPEEVEGGSDDPEIEALLEGLWDYDDLPAELTDAQLDELMRLVLKPFHVIEAALTDEQRTEAQQILASTPERPAPQVHWDEETGEPSPDYAGNETAERLDRVTQLFGRRYALELLS